MSPVLSPYIDVLCLYVCSALLLIIPDCPGQRLKVSLHCHILCHFYGMLQDISVLIYRKYKQRKIL